MRQACVRKDAPGSRMLTKAVFICSLAAVQSTFVNWTDAAIDGELSQSNKFWCLQVRFLGMPITVRLGLQCTWAPSAIVTSPRLVDQPTAAKLTMYLHIYLKLLPPLLQAILSRFCGCTTTQMGPLLSTQSHRTVSDHYCTDSPCKSGINGALFQVSCSSTILSPTFAPFSKKMHFWVFLLFCVVPF